MSNASQPNILLIRTDQLRADHVSFLGDAPVPTPHIDACAATMAFQRCQTVNPICTPARTALLTGKYPHQIGTLDMSGDLSRQHPTYPQALQQAGYHTAALGKLHYNQGWPWGTPEGLGHHLVELEGAMHDYGFTELFEVSGKQLANKNYCRYAERLDQAGVLQAYRDHVTTCGSNVPHANQSDVIARDWPFADDLYVDEVICAGAIKSLETRPADKPYFGFVSFCGPHPPYDPPAHFCRDEDALSLDELPCIPGPEPLNTQFQAKLPGLRRAYRGMIRQLDAAVGRLLASLDRLGMRDNTVLIFTCDHGEMLGDHGVLQKSQWYDAASRVPTGITDPRLATQGKIYTDPIELTDLTATICDLAGIDPSSALSKPWPAFHGHIPCRSLLPLLHGEQQRIRDFSFTECKNVWQMIRDARYTYVRFLTYEHPDHPNELLFDDHADPDQLVNLAHAADHQERLAALRRRRDWVLDHTPPAQLRWAPIQDPEDHLTLQA